MLSKLTIIEGLYLVYHQDTVPGGPGVLVAMYWVAKVMQSCVLSVALLHGNYHIAKNGRTTWYMVFMFTWCSLAAVSSLPAILQLPQPVSALIVQHPFVIILESSMYGLLLWIAFYFISIEGERSTRRKVIISLTTLGLCGGLAWTTGYFI